MKASKSVFLAIAVSGVAALSFMAVPGCGSGIGSSYTYSSTSTRGDYAEWTITGTNTKILWKVTDSTGAITMTHNVIATCGAADATYAYRTCTVTSATCTNGTQTCSGTASGTFDMMDVPGVALFVHTGSGTTSDQLHVGILKDSTACSADISGDYTYVRAGLGNSELFGMYRTGADFTTVSHADFGLTAATSTTTPTVAYLTNGGTGTGDDTLGGTGCGDGVRERTGGSSTFRSMMTRSGLFIFDMPAGQGGIISFKTSYAASLSDLANKSFAGISFPDNSAAQAIAGTTGASTGTSVPITAQVKGVTGTQAFEFRPFTNTTSLATSPAFPNFTSTPTNYSNNATIRTSYSTPSTFPGMFRVDGSLTDSGRVVLAAMKYNGKVIIFGVTYNWRTTTQTKPDGTNFPSDGLYNTGNFLLFEK